MIKISLIIMVFIILTLYLMFAHVGDKTLRRTYYFPFCTVTAGALFLLMSSLPVRASAAPKCEETNVSDMVSKHLNTVNYDPNSLHFSETTEYIDNGERRCKFKLRLSVLGNSAERLMITYHYNADDTSHTHPVEAKLIEVFAYRVSH